MRFRGDTEESAEDGPIALTGLTAACLGSLELVILEVQ
jgi:hypothetical protein